MKYTRIFCDAAGESHFEQISVEVAPVDFAPPAPPLNLSTAVNSERILFCFLPSGWFGDWHPAPRRQFYFQVSGELEVEVSDGEARKFSAGSVVLLEDTSGRGHATRVLGDRGVEAMFVQLPDAAKAP